MSSEQQPIEDVPKSYALLDYVVVGGKFYDVQADEPGGDPYLVKVDGIPDEYLERWSDVEE